MLCDPGIKVENVEDLNPVLAREVPGMELNDAVNGATADLFIVAEIELNAGAGMLVLNAGAVFVNCDP